MVRMKQKFWEAQREDLIKQVQTCKEQLQDAQNGLKMKNETLEKYQSQIKVLQESLNKAGEALNQREVHSPSQSSEKMNDLNEMIQDSMALTKQNNELIADLQKRNQDLETEISNLESDLKAQEQSFKEVMNTQS